MHSSTALLRTSRLAAVLTLTLTAATSCITTPSHAEASQMRRDAVATASDVQAVDATISKSAAAETPPPQEPVKQDAKKDSKDDEKSKAEKMAEAVDKLADAKVELQTAQLRAQASILENTKSIEVAERKVASKQRLVELATADLENFKTKTSPQKLSTSELRLDRSRHSRELAVDELAELEAMYAEEDLAAKTKELVLKRGRKSLEFSSRELEMSQRRADALRTFELPKELEAKEHALKKAAAELTDAEHSLKKSKLDVQISKIEMLHKIEKAKRKIVKLRAQAKGKS